MAKRDFVFGPDGEMLPSDSTVASDRRREQGGNVSTAKPATKKETFREAFARNRAAGKDTFTWNGKKYTTEMAKPAAKKAPAAKTAPADARRPGPTRERAADMPAMTRTTPVRPDASTSRGVRAAAPAPAPTPAPAQRPKTGFQAQRERDEQRRAERREFGRQRSEARDAERLEANRASAERLRNDPRQQELRAAREARESMSPAERSMARGRRLKEMFQRSPSEERQSKRPVRGMAKGGSVSKRADGIAKKGKTKCKII